MRIIYLSENLVPAVAPTLVLESIDQVTQYGVTCTVNISSDGGSTITGRGIQVGTTSNFSGWLVQSNPDYGTTGRFSQSANPLTPGIFYYVRAYAVNSVGATYSNVMTFTSATTAVAPSISLVSISNISATGASFTTNATSDGGESLSSRGCNFYINSDCSGTPISVWQNEQLGTLSGVVSTLSPQTTYYARAWAQNSAGTTNSNVISFSTASTTAVPTLLLNSITDIGLNSAQYSVTITSNGGDYIVSKGCSFYTNSDFSGEYIDATHGGGDGTFGGYVTVLLPQTTYYARAWAENSNYRGVSNSIQFTTPTAGVVQIDIVEPHYIVLRYIWELIDGTDLDTLTEFVASGVTGLDYQPVGWRFPNMNSNILNILKWSGDNVLSGQENVLIDITALRAAPGVIENSVVDIYANWYAVKGSRHTCTIELKAYRGGTMTQQGFLYTNSGGILIYSSESTIKSVDAVDPVSHSPNNFTTFRTGGYTKLGRVEYTYSTETAKLIF